MTHKEYPPGRDLRFMNTEHGVPIFFSGTIVVHRKDNSLTKSVAAAGVLAEDSNR